VKLEEGYRCKVLEVRVALRIFGPKRENVNRILEKTA
jgi:hypothetical protein